MNFKKLSTKEKTSFLLSYSLLLILPIYVFFSISMKDLNIRHFIWIIASYLIINGLWAIYSQTDLKMEPRRSPLYYLTKEPIFVTGSKAIMYGIISLLLGLFFLFIGYKI
jgi:hypothetical protein